MRDLYPGRKISVIFQPHLYSRTRDLCDGFAQALSLADELLLLPIYPARELPIEGVTSQIILDKVTCPVKSIYTKENLINSLHLLNFEVCLTLGAGDVVNMLPQMCQEIKLQQR